MLLGLALLLTCFATGQTLQDAKVELYNTNDTVARNMLFDLLHANSADKAEPAYYLGIDYSYLRQYDSAALFFEMAIKAAPQSPLSSAARAMLAYIHGDSATIETELTKAVTLAGNNADMYLQIANVYNEFTPYHDKAINILEKALIIDPKNPLIPITMASAYAQMADQFHSALYFTQTVELLENTRALNDKLTVTWLREGGDLTKLACFDMPDLRKTGLLKRILKAISPEKAISDTVADQELLSDTAVKNIILDAAIVCLKHAVTANVRVSNAWLLLGNAEYRRKYPASEIINAYETAGTMRKERYYDACFNLGIVYGELNDLEKADDNLKCAYYSRPDSVSIRFMIAQNYAKLNRPDLVTYWMNKGLEVKKPDAADYYLVGTAFGKVGHNLKKAIEYLKKAIAIDPVKELYYEDLGVAYGLNGQYNEAISTAKKLIELNPDYAPAYINLAISYRNKKDEKMAGYYQAKYDKLTAPGNK